MEICAYIPAIDDDKGLMTVANAFICVISASFLVSGGSSLDDE